MIVCPFCELIAEYGFPEVLPLKPLNPVTEGHLLFIPREHVKDAGEKPKVTARVMEEASRYAGSLLSDFNIITSKGLSATQSVYHLHIHVVPRRYGDGLKLPWSKEEGD